MAAVLQHRRHLSSKHMQITQHIAQVLGNALGGGPEQAAQVAELLTAPPKPEMGDVAFPCFQLAKTERKAPPLIAKDLAGRIQPDGIIASAEAQGPYLNFRLQRSAVAARVVGAILADPEHFGSRGLGNGKTLVLDFSAPNIAKPFHFGHLRSTNIGADLARIFAFQGWKVIRKNYLGDWGTQFGFVIYAWQQWGDDGELEARAIDYLVELYIRAYKASDADPTIRDQARNLFLRLEQGDPEIRALWTRFRDLSLAGFMATYERLGIAFDSYDGESAINDRVQPVIDRFVKAGVAVRSEGALVVPVADVLGRDIAPCMLQKSDGASTYAARDCAEALARWEQYRFDANIYVVSRQEDHFAQVFAALGKLAAAEGWAVNWAERCENVSFGFVRGMSTRKGEAVWLDAVLNEAKDQARRVREAKSAANPRSFPALSAGELDEVSEAVGLAAVLYFDVSSRRLTDITFDWDTVLQFEGNTGPYLQYSHARMSGIHRKAAAAGIAPATDAEALGRLTHDAEWALILKLRAFGDALERAMGEREPFEVAHYLHELSAVFNGFYNACQVIEPGDPVLSGARLTLVGATRSVLRTGLKLLGLKALDTM
jgi:arginyl-tRNA synthetase